MLERLLFALFLLIAAIPAQSAIYNPPTGGGGSGTVSSGAAGNLGYYPSTGTTIGPLPIGNCLAISGGILNTTDITNPRGSSTSYTVLSTDMCKTVTHAAGSTVSETLPQAGTTGFPPGVSYTELNLGAGNVVITPTTSTINGAATLTLAQNESAYITSDGTNYIAFLGKGQGGVGQIQPTSSYTADTAGNLFPYVYTGTGGNASASEAGWGVVASLGSNVVLQLRFAMPTVIPSGTFNLISYCQANATSGVVKYTVSDANVASGSSPSTASLTAETQTSITWSAADVYVRTATPLTSTPTANGMSVVAVTFNTSGWTLAQILSCKFYETWL